MAEIIKCVKCNSTNTLHEGNMTIIKVKYIYTFILKLKYQNINYIRQ